MSKYSVFGTKRIRELEKMNRDQSIEIYNLNEDLKQQKRENSLINNERSIHEEAVEKFEKKLHDKDELMKEIIHENNDLRMQLRMQVKRLKGIFLHHAKDAKTMRAWQCGICMEGMDEDTGGSSELEAAHAGTVSADGTHVLHVFHRHCLQSWRDNKSNCPTCRLPLQTEPLVNVWVAGNTTLARRMGLELGSALSAPEVARNPCTLASCQNG